MHPSWRPRRAICRPWSIATTRTTTARKSDARSPVDGMPGPHRAVEIPHLATILRIREPPRLNRRVPAEQAALIAGKAQPVLVLSAGAQAGVADGMCFFAATDENEQPDDCGDGDDGMTAPEGRPGLLEEHTIRLLRPGIRGAFVAPTGIEPGTGGLAAD